MDKKFSAGFVATKNLQHLPGTSLKQVGTLSRLDHWSLAHWGYYLKMNFSEVNQNLISSPWEPPRLNVSCGSTFPPQEYGFCKWVQVKMPNFWLHQWDSMYVPTVVGKLCLALSVTVTPKLCIQWGLSVFPHHLGHVVPHLLVLPF